MTDSTTPEKTHEVLIQGLARARIDNISTEWNFVNIESISLNGRRSAARRGSVSYANAAYEMGIAYRIGSYVFVLERLVKSKRDTFKLDESWMICAFNGQTHYNFAYIDDSDNLDIEFCGWLLDRIWPILLPDETARLRGTIPIVKTIGHYLFNSVQ